MELLLPHEGVGVVRVLRVGLLLAIRRVDIAEVALNLGQPVLYPRALDVLDCEIGVKVSEGLLVAVSCIDNLLKGAAGQAVQNMNIMCGFDEKEGLV